MAELTIPVKTQAFYTDEMRAHFLQAFAPGNPAGAFAVGQRYRFHGEMIDERSQGHVWTREEDGVVRSRSLFGAPIPAVVQGSAAYHIAMGHDPLVEVVESALGEMCEPIDFNPEYDVLCLSFGVLVIPLNPAIDMGVDAIHRGKDRVDQEVVDCHLRLILDAGLSAHTRLDALRRTEAFLATAIAQGLAARTDRARWDDLLDGVTFGVGTRRKEVP